MNNEYEFFYRSLNKIYFTYNGDIHVYRVHIHIVYISKMLHILYYIIIVIVFSDIIPTLVFVYLFSSSSILLDILMWTFQGCTETISILQQQQHTFFFLPQCCLQHIHCIFEIRLTSSVHLSIPRCLSQISEQL